MSKTRVYISGPITGTSDYMERFSESEKALERRGYSVINPAKIGAALPKDMLYEEIVAIDMKLLECADMIYMLRGWQTSIGANREYGYALGAGIDIVKQETILGKKPEFLTMAKTEQEGEEHE